MRRINFSPLEYIVECSFVTTSLGSVDVVVIRVDYMIIRL